MAAGRIALKLLAEAFVRLRGIAPGKISFGQRYEFPTYPSSSPSSSSTSSLPQETGIIREINQRWAERIPMMNEILERSERHGARWEVFEMPAPPPSVRPEPRTDAAPQQETVYRTPRPEEGASPQSTTPGRPASAPERTATNEAADSVPQSESSSPPPKTAQPPSPRVKPPSPGFFDPFEISPERMWGKIYARPPRSVPWYVQEQWQEDSDFYARYHADEDFYKDFLDNFVRIFDALIATVFAKSRVDRFFSILSLSKMKLIGPYKESFEDMLNKIMSVFFDQYGHLKDSFFGEEDVALAVLNYAKEESTTIFNRLIATLMRSKDKDLVSAVFKRLNRGEQDRLKEPSISIAEMRSKIQKSESNNFLSDTISCLRNYDLHAADAIKQEFVTGSRRGMGIYRGHIQKMIAYTKKFLKLNNPELLRQYELYDAFGILKSASEDPLWSSLPDEQGVWFMMMKMQEIW